MCQRSHRYWDLLSSIIPSTARLSKMCCLCSSKISTRSTSAINFWEQPLDCLRSLSVSRREKKAHLAVTFLPVVRKEDSRPKDKASNGLSRKGSISISSSTSTTWQIKISTSSPSPFKTTTLLSTSLQMASYLSRYLRRPSQFVSARSTSRNGLPYLSAISSWGWSSKATTISLAPLTEPLTEEMGYL